MMCSYVLSINGRPIANSYFKHCYVFNSLTPLSDSAGKDLLDCTRIHPETYEWARKMAVDALEYDEVIVCVCVCVCACVRVSHIITSRYLDKCQNEMKFVLTS